jgi:hypothetical protein
MMTTLAQVLMARLGGQPVNSGGQIFRYTWDQGDPNHLVSAPGSLSVISAGVKTNVWGVNKEGATLLFQHTTTTTRLGRFFLYSLLFALLLTTI